MAALISLYMVNQLLQPGYVEHIAGFAGLRAALEWVSGPLSTQALASQISGLYSRFARRYVLRRLTATVSFLGAPMSPRSGEEC